MSSMCPRTFDASSTSLLDFGLPLDAPMRTGKPISAAAGANARFEIKRFTSTNIGSKCHALAESIPPLWCEISFEEKSRRDETILGALG